MTDVIRVDFDDFIPRILNEVPMCPEDIARDAARDTCIDFCDETNFWQYDIDPITALAGVPDYDLDDLPDTTMLAGIVEMTFGGYQVLPRTKEWLVANIQTWKTYTETYPKFFMVPQIGKFRLVGYPATTLADAIDVTVAIKPTRDATQVYDRVYQDYLDEIVHGSLSRLMAMKTKDWSDPELSLYYKNLYETARGRAKIAVAKGHTQMSAVVMPRTLA